MLRPHFQLRPQNNHENRSFLENFLTQTKRAGEHSFFVGCITAGVNTFMKNYAAPIIGFLIGFFFIRVLCNLLFRDENHPFIKACRKLEKENIWVVPAIMFFAVAYLSPKWADSKWYKNLAFWIGVPCGGFWGFTYHPGDKH